VICTDPVNADAARWLKAEVAQRFGKPIRYVIYSHDHADHISGGEVLADTAQVVAHENARRTIVAEKRPTAVPTVVETARSRCSHNVGNARASRRRGCRSPRCTRRRCWRPPSRGAGRL
jgi:glyoxylase-like metal-dependent hydrolase (beta-lactamase superfamily II)